MLQKQRSYKHLNQSQRDSLYQHLSAGTSCRQIARLLGVHPSTIYREIIRNRHPSHHQYFPDTAQNLSSQRRNKPGSKIERSKRIQQYIQGGVAMLMSPEVIAGRLKLEQSEHTISHESIYKWIYNEGKSLRLHEYLRRRKRSRGLRSSKKSRKSRIPNRMSIAARPPAKPEDKGHWEADTIHLSGKSDTIVTLYNKATKVVFASRQSSRTSQETIDTLEAILSSCPADMRQTVTFDNGSEFTRHEQLKRNLGIETYFCDPYSSWQKGGVENANSLIRRHIPKQTKGVDCSAEYVQQVVHRINMTPRKSLGYLSPYEMLLKVTGSKSRMLTFFNNQSTVALRL